MFGQPLSELSSWMKVFPQIMINVPVREKPPLESVPELQQVLTTAEAALAGRGRTLVRYSGTEPVCRVMVEAESETEADRHAQDIARVIQQSLG
jgi:phosphoglucosamine mutase